MQEIFENILKELKNELNKVQSKCKSIAIKDGRSLDYEFYGGKSEAYTKAIEIVGQVATDYNGGWIPCSERLPEEMELVLIYAESTARGGSIRVVAQLDNGFWFAQTSSETLGLTGIGQYNVVAWQPLPPEYQPNICTAGDCAINDGNGCPAAEGCAGYQPKGE